MPRISTFPTLYDECKQISITDLKRWDYLKLDQSKRGVINWHMGEQKTGSISILVDTNLENPFLELDYKTAGYPIKYEVSLVTVPSNLGKGHLWYFLCPQTGKRCRKLYLIGDRFLHREAFQGCFYEKQVQSKSYKDLDRTFGRAFRAEDAYEEMHKPHFKRYYKGKPTKRYLRLFKKANPGSNSHFTNPTPPVPPSP